MSRGISGRKRVVKFAVNHNYDKILKSDWLSTALISTLIGQYTSCLSNQGPYVPTMVTSMKTSPTNRLCILSLFFAIISRGPVTKRREFGLELKRGTRARDGTTEMVEFIALPFPFPSKLKIQSFDVEVMQGRQRNVQSFDFKKSLIYHKFC